MNENRQERPRTGGRDREARCVPVVPGATLRDGDCSTSSRLWRRGCRQASGHGAGNSWGGGEAGEHPAAERRF